MTLYQYGEKKYPMLRVAERSDLPAVVSLKIQMFRDAGREHLLCKDAYQIILQDYKELYSRMECNHHIWVSDNNIVAMSGAFIKRDIPYRYFVKSTYGFLGDVYTQKGYRRKGLASQLCKESINWLKSHGVDTVRLLATEQAQSIYERMGFKKSEEMVLGLGVK